MESIWLGLDTTFGEIFHTSELFLVESEYTL